MLVYFGVLFFLLVGSGIEWKSENRGVRENFFKFSLLLLIFFFGLRGYIGYDWYSYQPNFETIPTIKYIFNSDYHKIFFSSYEIGFQLYTALIKTLTKNYFIYNFIGNGVDFLALYFIIKRYSKYPILSLTIYFAVYGLALEIDMIRNMKSILLFLLSVEYIEERKPFKFFLLNLLGVFFHMSSILYFPMYFILKKNWNRKLILVLFIIGNIYYLSDSRIFMKFIVEHNSIFPLSIGRRLVGYFSIIPLDFPLGFSLYYLERVVVFFLCWFIDEKLKEQRYGGIFLNSLYIWIFFFLYFSEFSIISFRFGLLFVYSYWFLLPMVLEFYPKVIIYLLIFTILIFRLSNQLYFVGNRIVYPYQNIIFKYEPLEKQRKKVEEAGRFKSLGHGKEISLLF